MTTNRPLGFLATPPGGSGPGVLVLHAWWGLNGTIKNVCTRLADEGYVAFAPDLYRGRIATTIEDAERLSGGLDADSARADIAAALDFLGARVGSAHPGLGVIGFSLGAWFAAGLSAEEPERIRAVVLFYGTGDADFRRARASYLGHFAENDPFESQAAVAALEDGLRAAGRPVTFHRYPGTGHWFFEPDREDAYVRAAADQAWQRTLAFLREQIPRQEASAAGR